jgi:hypothetical protein
VLDTEKKAEVKENPGKSAGKKKAARPCSLFQFDQIMHSLWASNDLFVK